MMLKNDNNTYVKTYNKCELCNKLNSDSPYYKFCDISCSKLYYFFIELRTKSMEHGFDRKDDNKLICKICGYDYLSHTSAATCSNCGTLAKCDIFDNKLLCTNKCFIEFQDNAKNNLKSNEAIINPILEKARNIDSKMKMSGYFFNAEVIPHEELRLAIENDNTIPDEDKKNRFFQELVKRFTTFQEEIVNIDNRKHELVERQLKIADTLRSYGNQVREEYRNKLKQSDSLYSPIEVKKVTSNKVKSVAQNPFERMAELVAKNKNISLAEAKRQLIENGMMPTS